MTGYSQGENRTSTQLATETGSGINSLGSSWPHKHIVDLADHSQGLNKAILAAGHVRDIYWLDEASRMACPHQLDLHSTLQAEEGAETGDLKGSLTAVATLA